MNDVAFGLVVSVEKLELLSVTRPLLVVAAGGELETLAVLFIL
jgi:hypothetical protein